MKIPLPARRWLRITFRLQMLLILLAAVFFAGIKVGQRKPVNDGPGPRAMAFVKRMKISSNNEAAALFNAAQILEEREPDCLQSTSIVRISSTSPYNWDFSFRDRISKKEKRVTGGISIEAVQDYIKKRDRGFDPIAP
jgi:hypothetical protein